MRPARSARGKKRMTKADLIDAITAKAERQQGRRR